MSHSQSDHVVSRLSCECIEYSGVKSVSTPASSYYFAIIGRRKLSVLNQFFIKILNNRFSITQDFCILPNMDIKVATFIFISLPFFQLTYSSFFFIFINIYSLYRGNLLCQF
jgi:hypothetical protein